MRAYACASTWTALGVVCDGASEALAKGLQNGPQQCLIGFSPVVELFVLSDVWLEHFESVKGELMPMYCSLACQHTGSSAAAHATHNIIPFATLLYSQLLGQISVCSLDSQLRSHLQPPSSLDTKQRTSVLLSREEGDCMTVTGLPSWQLKHRPLTLHTTLRIMQSIMQSL